MGCTLFWVKFSKEFAYFVVSCSLARWRYFQYKFLFCLQDQTVPYSSCRHEKFISAQESFYLQGILNDIIEQYTSFLDCKHKHMMKCGALPDKLGVLYCMFTYGIP